MTSKQINFFFSQEDLQELEDYAFSHNWQILAHYSPSTEVVILDSIFAPTKGWKFLVQPSQIDQVKKYWVDTQNYYAIEISASPLIELVQLHSDPEQKILGRGRVYFEQIVYVDGQAVRKDEHFLQAADALFKWIRKHFRGSQPEGYKGFLISPRVKNWIENEGGTLREN
jgi:hypothetical protein